MARYRFFLSSEEQRKRYQHRVAGAVAVLQDPDVGDVGITGITLWARRDGTAGDLSVTFPAERRAKKADEAAQDKKGESEYYDYVRPADEEGKGIKALRAGLLKAFREQFPAEALRASAGSGATAPEVESR